MISRWDPFRDLSVLQDRINRVFNDAGRGTTEAASSSSWGPVVDILETESDLVVRAEIPGMKRDDIEVEVTAETLAIRGERPFPDQDRENLIRVERPYGPFQRSFSIGVPVQSDKVKATYRDGVLEVAIPKAEEVKPKKVEIKAE